MTETPTNALIERLESRAELLIPKTSITDHATILMLTKLLLDTAEALRTLTAENERLTTNLRHWKEECGKVHAKVAALTEQRDEQNRLYKGALRNVQTTLAHSAELNKQLEQHQWRRVEDELPEEGKVVEWFNAAPDHNWHSVHACKPTHSRLYATHWRYNIPPEPEKQIELLK